MSTNNDNSSLWFCPLPLTANSFKIYMLVIVLSASTPFLEALGTDLPSLRHTEMSTNNNSSLWFCPLPLTANSFKIYMLVVLSASTPFVEASR